MGKHILIDEVHVSVYVLRGLPEPEYDAIRRVLDSSQFRQRLKRAVRRVVRRFTSLNKMRIAVSR